MISDQGPEQVLESHGDSIITTKADGCVKLDINQDHEVAGWEAISVPGLLSKAVQAAPDVPALAVKRQDQWVKWTYKEYLQDVRTVAKAFIALGLEPRQSVGILGFNSPEWFFSDLAAIFCNAISVGIYTTNSPEMCKYMAEHSKANILVVEDANQLKKILEIKEELKDLKAIVQYTGTPEHPGVLSWQELMD